MAREGWKSVTFRAITKLIFDDSRRVECDPDEAHFHVWEDTGVFIPQPPRFRTNAAARKAAVRADLEPGSFMIRRCRLPCRFTLPKPRKRKRRKCRHCGRVP